MNQNFPEASLFCSVGDKTINLEAGGGGRHVSKKLTLVIISRKNNTISFSVFSMQFDEKSFYFADIHRNVPMYMFMDHGQTIQPLWVHAGS